jgi:hypothetical protein
MAMVVICLLGEKVRGLVVCVTANGLSGAAAGLCMDAPVRQPRSGNVENWQNPEIYEEKITL